MTEDRNILTEARVSGRIHVVLSRTREADLDFADVAMAGDDLATISDPDLLARVERRLDLPQGRLAGMKVNRPQTGNIVIGVPDVYGQWASASTPSTRGKV